MALISMTGVTKRYFTGATEIEILHGIDLSIEKNQFVAIMGKSGSGKTTLMNIIGCLDVPSSGSYLLDGQDITTADADTLAKIRNQKIGFVFQTFNLLEDLTVLENVALPQLYANKTEHEAEEKAKEVLKMVDLADRIEYYPNQLSGGQRQRVAIARALVKNPEILLADEPTGNLDSKTGLQILQIFKTLYDERGITIIMVTHDHELARHAANIILISDGQIVKDNE